LWSTSKALHTPLDKKIKTLPEMPYTISYVIRKRQQIDSLAELPKEKRPPDSVLWDGTSEEIDRWLDNVMGSKQVPDIITITEDDIER
jgi:hypothetical protein